MSDTLVQTWHHGLVARWWAEFNLDGPEIAYFRRQVERFGEPALDLGCGSGRLLHPLLAAGLDVDGCDVSADMLAWCRRRGEREGRTPALYQQAMHTLALPRAYGTVFICGAFGLGVDRALDLEALRRIRAHLRPGGALVFDHYLPYVHPRSWGYWLKGGRADLPAPWPDRGSRKSAADGTDLEIRTRLRHLDPATQHTISDIRVRHWQGADVLAEEEHTLRSNLYFVPELRLMLETAGFRAVTVHTAYSHEPAAADSTVVVIVARGDAWFREG